ncbi:O antigen biosynthesis rhamnosyltransferase rfbN [Lachnospiraceae bacterium KM106-2]|nr:O antigen biosynthesis rhamnosyltransferase rfbN [Lachnospiraceae bacterium KM106-2]
MKIDLIIPTYKPDAVFDKLMERMKEQTVKPNRIIIMNTEKEYFDEAKYSDMDNVEVIHITKAQFDHGGTRNYGASLSDADYIMLMTQDAVPADQYLVENMLKAFEHENVAAVYGRQLARKNAGIIEKYTRTFNYPAEDMIKSAKDLERLGIKTFFCSNVCAAYKKSVYDEIGGFVTKTIFNEDMILASHVIDLGYSIYYASDAKVIHSHTYTYREQLRRNFDLAVSHKQYHEIFGRVKSESEGIKYVKKTVKYLAGKKKYLTIIDFVMDSGFKFMGYKLGLRYDKLPKWLVLKLSMQPSYWMKKEKQEA